MFSLSFAGSASPVISPDISALVVNVSDPVLLRCSGESEVKWYPEKFANHASSTLSIPRTTHRDTGTYRCAYINSSDKGIASVHLYVRGNHSSILPCSLAEWPLFRERGH